ncbi:MAG: hypothetical protein JNL82_24100 [Myxococcales bacterium]|nr:hypothetical protein [Myxococcales bacterium]
MENWIQKVRYLPDNSAIEAVKYSPADKPNSILLTMLVSEVVESIRKGGVYYTARRRHPNDHLPVRGAQVILTTDGKFITTAPTNNTLDNLENLPRFIT